MTIMHEVFYIFLLHEVWRPSVWSALMVSLSLDQPGASGGSAHHGGQVSFWSDYTTPPPPCLKEEEREPAVPCCPQKEIHTHWPSLVCCQPSGPHSFVSCTAFLLLFALPYSPRTQSPGP